MATAAGTGCVVELLPGKGRLTNGVATGLQSCSRHASSVPEGVAGVSLPGEYAPSTRQWVRDQVEAYERSGGQEANTLRETGLPVVIVTMRGNKSGKVRKIALTLKDFQRR